MGLLIPTIVLIAVNAGGVGKTFFAETTDALARILSIAIKLASYDDGNHALIRSLGEDRVTRITNDDVGIAKGRKVIKTMLPFDLFVSDCGANALGGTGAADQLAIGYKFEADLEEFKLVAALPSASGKVGGLNSAITAYRNLSAANIDCWLILNDINGSSGFGRDEIPDDLKRSHIAHLPAGFQALRVESGRSLYDLITNPDPGYELAGKFTYAWLYTVAQAPIFREIFGSALSDLPEPEVKLRDVSLAIAKVADTTNEKLKCNLELRRSQNILRSSMSTDDELMKAALHYRDAWVRYHAVDPI